MIVSNSWRHRWTALLTATVVAAAPACTASTQTQQTKPTRTTTATTSASCAGWMKHDTLPAWARGGFHPPTQRARYVIGADHNIVGVLFGYPLTSPPPAGSRHNKILWVANPNAQVTTPAPGPGLQIRAQLRGSTTVATRHVDVGPSYVTLPSAGCWHLSLSWSRYHDTVRLRYRPR